MFSLFGAVGFLWSYMISIHTVFHTDRKCMLTSWMLQVNYMGESFQDYSWIQDIEADFPQKVSLKMLN